MAIRGNQLPRSSGLTHTAGTPTTGLTTEVSRDVILRALRVAGPPHSEAKLMVIEDQQGIALTRWSVSIRSDVFATVEWIPLVVGRDLPNRLHRKFKVPKEWFYNELLIPDCNVIN